ncbi:MAG: Cys-tRNA(Pro) deacylase [Sphaerochaeta sp.]|nr:Cys-tRNA(Pro) deacylase [Sphaerochaeta sp.]
MKKTNAIRILEREAIDFEIVTYEWDEEHLDAISASGYLGVEAHHVYKTIVCEDGQGGHHVFCLPAEFSVNLKKARSLTGRWDLVPLKLAKLKEVTGYIRGGCSPIGMKSPFPTYIEELSQLEQYIFVSAGERGLQVKIRPSDLVRVCKGILADFT